MCEGIFFPLCQVYMGVYVSITLVVEQGHACAGLECNQLLAGLKADAETYSYEHIAEPNTVTV